METEQKKLFNLDDLIKLAEDGDVDAQLKLGNYYFYGQHGLTIDYDKSIKWWTLAANNGNAKAQNNLASCYAEGRGVTTNQEKALMWFEKAAVQGSLEAIFNLGKGYLLGHTVFDKDVSRGFLYMKEAAEKGLAEAQFMLGSLYHDGVGCKLDLNESIRWLDKAVQQDHKKATTMLGDMLYRFRGHNRADFERAICLLSKTANEGDSYAQQQLGEIHLRMGQIEESVKWFKIASEQNEPKALLFMGLLCNIGIMLPKDYDKAIQYIEKFFAIQKIHKENVEIENDLKANSYKLACSLGNAALFGSWPSRFNYTKENHDIALAYFNAALELVEDDEDHASMKIDAIFRIASVYRKDINPGIARLLYSKAKWLSLLHHDMTRYLKSSICELQILRVLKLDDEVDKFLQNAYQHFEESDYHMFNVNMDEPIL